METTRERVRKILEEALQFSQPSAHAEDTAWVCGLCLALLDRKVQFDEVFEQLNKGNCALTDENAALRAELAALKAAPTEARD